MKFEITVGQPTSAEKLPKEDVIYHSVTDSEEKLVFLNQQRMIDWRFRPENKELMPLITRVYAQVAGLEADIHPWPDGLKERCKRRIAMSIVFAMNNDRDNIESLLESGTKYIQAVSALRGRTATAITGLSSLVVIAVLALVAVECKAALEAMSISFAMVVFCFLSGAFGGVLFLLSGIGSKPNEEKFIVSYVRIYVLEAIARIVVGGIGGVLVGLFVKLGIILPVFTQNGSQNLAICSAAMLAGVSERLLNGVITNLSSVDDETQKAVVKATVEPSERRSEQPIVVTRVADSRGSIIATTLSPARTDVEAS